jgi:hypothetical protein
MGIHEHTVNSFCQVILKRTHGKRSTGKKLSMAIYNKKIIDVG